MKTIRTIIGTLAGVLLTFALVAWFSVRRNAAFIQRTIYQGFDQTFVVALVMGCAFLLIAVILTVAIASTDEDDEEEEDPLPTRYRTRPLGSGSYAPPRSAARSAAPRQSAVQREEEPYRRVSRTRALDEERAAGRYEEADFARPRDEERPARKRERTAMRPDEITLRGEDAPVKKGKKAQNQEPRPRRYEAEETEEPVRRVKRPEAEPQPKPKKRPAPEPVHEEPEEEAETILDEEIPEETFEEAVERASQEPEEELAPRKREQGTIHCIFCGGQMSRDAQVCPHCGKKR